MTTDYPSPEKQNNNDMDIIIGRKIKFRRKLLGMTQQSLAEKLGISFQQIQNMNPVKTKYMPAAYTKFL